MKKGNALTISHSGRGSRYYKGVIRSLKPTYHEHTGLLSIHEALGNSIGGKDFIPEGNTGEEHIGLFLNKLKCEKNNNKTNKNKKKKQPSGNIYSLTSV